MVKSAALILKETNLETKSIMPQYINVTNFDFKTQLQSLLNDKILFGNIENLDINLNDPFGKYKPPGNILSTVNSGMRYQQAYKTMIEDKENDFLLPIIFACDETQITNLSKATSWPLSGL